jgi:hypothetical protein
MTKTLRGLVALFALVSTLSFADETPDSFIDLSGTVTLGGTSQTLAAANPGRQSIHITHSTAETEVLCVNTTSAASCTTAGTYVIAAGGSLCLNTKEKITVVATTTGHKYTAKEAGSVCPVLSNGGAASGGGAVTNAGTFAVQPAGSVAHDGVATAVNPILVGCYASAAAPADVSNDSDSVRAWCRRNGARVIEISLNGVLASAGSGVNGTGVQRMTIATDDVIIAAINTALATLNTSVNTTFAVSTATLANVAASATSVTCLASNASRKGAIFVNDSASATAYFKYGATASATSYTFQVLPGGTLILPTAPIYTGIVDCIWSAAAGSARVTEE